MSESAQQNRVAEIKAEIEQRMGLCPSFFLLAANSPETMQLLWRQAQDAYLDNPLPSLFKEKLFAYLSRFCRISYCMARHCGFLLGKGRVAGDPGCDPLAPEEVLRLLQDPLVMNDELAARLRTLDSIDAPLEPWPQPGDEVETSLIACSVPVFLRQGNHEQCLEALRRVLGPTRCDHLLLLFAFIQTAHFWTETHPELAYEGDVQRLLDEQHALNEWIHSYPSAVGEELRQETLDELAQLRTVHSALRKSEQRLLATIESAPVAIVMSDRAGRIVLVNARTENLLGYSRDELLGQPVERLVPTRFRAQLAAYRADYFENPGVRELSADQELFALRKDGSEFPVDVGLSPIETEDGLFVLSTLFDLTERKQAEKALRQLSENLSQQVEDRTHDLRDARDDAEAANRAKSEFLANMSHEIRTPMNGVIGMTELLLKTSLSPDQRHYLDLVRQSAESLLVLIDDILDFSKIEAGKLELFPAEFNLHDLLGATLQGLGHRAAEKRLELAYRVAPEVPVCLVGDASRLRQIVVNLVSNAIKFTKQGEVVAEVELEASEVSGDESEFILHFRVRDTGCGIPAEKREAIFESFTQVDGTAQRRFGGTGLGLTISRQLVEMMDGRIWVESEVDAGTTVHFTARFGVGEGSGRITPAPPESLHQLRVLVVDDNATNREILEESLRMWRMKPLIAKSGPQALEILEQESATPEPVQLILLDMMMPKMDGESVAREVRKRFGDGAPKMLILSSLGQLLSTRKMTKLGISRVLTKPVRASQLLDAIAQAFGASEMNADKPPSITAAVSVRPLRVLLAEDNQINRIVALKLLEERGHSVTAVENGAEALQELEREPFDAVVMDVQMPVMDGIAAAKEIRHREKITGRKPTPIIALTADAMQADRERCLAVGMDGYVAKPVRSAELYAALEQGGTRTDQAAQSLEMRDQEGIFDPETFRKAMKDPHLMRDMIDAYREELPRWMEAAETALADGDGKALHRVAHALKGMVGNFTIGEPYQQTNELYMLTNSGQLTQDIETMLNSLQEQLTGLKDELEAFSATL